MVSITTPKRFPLSSLFYFPFDSLPLRDESVFLRLRPGFVEPEGGTVFKHISPCPYRQNIVTCTSTTARSVLQPLYWLKAKGCGGDLPSGFDPSTIFFPTHHPLGLGAVFPRGEGKGHTLSRGSTEGYTSAFPGIGPGKSEVVHHPTINRIRELS